MQLIPLPSPSIIQPGENLFEKLTEALKAAGQTWQEKDIIILAETVVATCEGRIVDLQTITTVSQRAKDLGSQYRLDPREVELILQEADQIFGGLPGLLLTEKQGVMVANAGIDRSNAGGNDRVVLWPQFPFKSAEELLDRVKKAATLQEFGVIVSDSRVHPLRKGVIGVAIGVAGFHPIDDCRGRKDLFGLTLNFTTRAVADQLADAAHLLMGEADERVPFVLARGVPVRFCSDPIEPKSLVMPLEEDLFVQILGEINKQKI
jgi:coenzyme F420-0:L-glutamate ligase / coenzyme F420-1:gamma-L-glutamate ligase